MDLCAVIMVSIDVQNLAQNFCLEVSKFEEKESPICLVQVCLAKEKRLSHQQIKSVCEFFMQLILLPT